MNRHILTQPVTGLSILVMPTHQSAFVPLPGSPSANGLAIHSNLRLLTAARKPTAFAWRWSLAILLAPGRLKETRGVISHG